MTILMPELRGKYSGPVVNQGEPWKRVQKLRSKGDIESPNLQPCRPKNYDEKKDRICNHVRLHSVFQSLTPKQVISVLEPFHAIAQHSFGNVLLSSQLNSKPKRKKGHLAASSILLWLLVTNRPFKPPGRKDVKTAFRIGNSRLHDNLHFHNAQWILMNS